jgi:formate dehydrogenase iron-sulfur subunit
MVGLWKGLTKPLALAGMAITALAGWFHYSRVGPNEVSKEEEAEAVEEANASGRKQNELATVIKTAIR